MKPKDDSANVSLRDIFACHALAALIAEPQWGAGGTPIANKIADSDAEMVRVYTNAAYKLADAMLLERER